MKALIAGLFAVALCGCVAVTAARTTTVAGNPVTETITVKSFLTDITDGTYATTNGMVLSTSSTTPDQQSIATLANGVVGCAGFSLVSRSFSRPASSDISCCNSECRCLSHSKSQRS